MHYKFLDKPTCGRHSLTHLFRLSEHFNLGELLHTNHGDTYLKSNYDNVTFTDVQNLTRLCLVLECIRKFLGSTPVSVSSGYRSVVLNHLVNGVPNSDHLFGRAADIRICRGSRLDKYLEDLKSLGVIRYYYWITDNSLHISIY